MFYIHSSDGVSAIGGLRMSLPDELKNKDKQTRIAAGWYDFISTAPECGEEETCVCYGFTRREDYFTGVYRIIENKQCEDTTS